jgi:hypothetical protein
VIGCALRWLGRLPWRLVRQGRRAAALLLWLVAGVGAGAQAQTPGPPPADGSTLQLQLRSDRHSDALPLSAYGGDAWAALQPRHGRNLVYLDDELRVEGRRGDWSVALLARSLATLVASEDALLLARDIAAGRRPATDTQWQTDLHLRAFSGAGLALGHQSSPAPGWTLQLSAQALQLARWRERQLSGPVSFSAADQRYRFDLQSQQLNDRLHFPFQDDQAGSGQGLLLGGELRWQGRQAWASAALRDGGWLHWRGVPQQLMRLNTATQTVDADGFVVYAPLIDGRYSQQGRTERWPWHGTLDAGLLRADGQRLGLQIDHLPGYGLLPALHWARDGDGQRPAWGARWQLHERRLTLSTQWRGWQLQAGADRLGAGARSRTLGLSYLHAWGG